MTLTEPALTKSIDARGMACPGPLLALIGAIRQGQVGDTFEVISSDAGSKTDIPAWVGKAKHELVRIDEEAGSARFIVRKAR
ncbi:MAG TPA: sulfurtransferase TusA family protein [Candidatus Limnocylindria bacterium]|nr:sulfurtransferase TusA family protein [Candidatus Limnocylindria bacterium]